VAVAEFQNNEYVVWSGVRGVPTLPIVFTVEVLGTACS
jgi:hypothetical protein